MMILGKEKWFLKSWRKIKMSNVNCGKQVHLKRTVGKAFLETMFCFVLFSRENPNRRPQTSGKCRRGGKGQIWLMNADKHKTGKVTLCHQKMP